VKISDYYVKASKAKDQSTKTKLATTDVTLRIYYSDDRAIGRRILAFERKARFLAPAPENQFADSGARGVDRYQRFSLWRQVFIKGLNDEQFPILERIVLYRGHNCSDYACQLHFTSPAP